MPKEMFKILYESLDKTNMMVYNIFNKLSEMFFVSPEAMRRRFPELNIFSYRFGI